jgi:hypothetical protein
MVTVRTRGKARLAVVLLLAVSALPILAQTAWATTVPTFATHIEYPTSGSGSVGVAMGDFTNSGVLDMVVVNRSSNLIAIMANDGSGVFTTRATMATGSTPKLVAVGKFFGTAYNDIAVANTGTTTVSLFKNKADGSGTFDTGVTTAAGATPTGIATGDFNGDGHLDLVVTNKLTSGTVSVLINNGDGTFANPVAYAVRTSPSGVAVADFNGDGHLDLAVANSGSNAVSLLTGNADGTFNAPYDLITPSGAAPATVAVGNFDGHPDVVSAEIGFNEVSVFLNTTGAGTFATHVDYPTGAGPQDVNVADVNGDRIPDIVVTNLSSSPTTVSVLTGTGTGTFNAKTDFAAATGNTPAILAVGDLNGDGHPDIAATDNATHVSVLLNTTSTWVPAITSANATTFTAGSAGTFTVTATGTPTPTITKSGTLPTGVTFVDNGNSTATLAGTATTAGTYTLTVTAHNTAGSDAVQTFTLTVTAGTLSISVPATASLGSGTLGSSVSSALGSVQVIDNRGSATAAWTATVSTTTFTSSGGATVPLANTKYWSGASTSTTGTGTFTAGQATAGSAQDLTTSRTAFTLTSGNSTDEATWNPTLIVIIPITLVPGTYTATVTHSVA